MISRVEAHNYRCFAALSTRFSRYHVIAGTHGAGKSTLLDIVLLLSDLLRCRVPDAFLQQLAERRPPRATTFDELLYQGRGDRIGFAIEAELPESVKDALDESNRLRPSRLTHLRYELSLRISSYAVDVGEEYLFLFSAHGPRPQSSGFPQDQLHDGQISNADRQPVISRDGQGTTVLATETGNHTGTIPHLHVPSSQLALGSALPDPTLFPAALWLHELLRDGVVALDLDDDLLHQPAPPGDPARVIPSGRNTPWLALDLQRTDPIRFASWVDHVRTALPEIADIGAVEREEDRHAYFRVRYAGRHVVTSTGLSGGTLRILALSLLPYLPSDALPQLLIKQNIETGIHPRAIETVVQSVSSLYDTQVWVSTHSPIVLAHTELADVLAARLDSNGTVTIVPGNQHPRLVNWQGSLDIGSLFAAGILS